MTPVIPAEKPPAERPSELTKSEMADLAPAKRSVMLYERLLSKLEADVFLIAEENKLLRSQLIETKDAAAVQVAQLTSLKDQNVELWVSFISSTCILTLGGAWISSYPMIADHTPWQFVAGWCCIVLGILLCLANRLCVAVLGWAGTQLKS